MICYKLIGKLPVPCNLLEFGDMLADIDKRRVALDQIGPVEVSTVFIGLDHGFGVGDPLLFETMVSGLPEGEEFGRYTTWDEAEKGHAVAVEAVREIVEKAEKLLVSD